VPDAVFDAVVAHQPLRRPLVSADVADTVSLLAGVTPAPRSPVGRCASTVGS
jgi:hypothetical protein